MTELALLFAAIAAACFLPLGGEPEDEATPPPVEPEVPPTPAEPAPPRPTDGAAGLMPSAARRRESNEAPESRDPVNP